MNLGLINNKVNVTILLFWQKPTVNSLLSHYKVSKFIGDEPAPKMEKKIDENLMEQIEKSYIEVLSLIKREIEVKGLVGIEVYEYLPKAIRELIVNAVTHRDYSMRSPIYIKISN
ncbi:MAG: hypothetical protein QXM35_03380 [Candidatus Methanomethylicia archaeon]